jgi:hypothetical protein
MDLSLHKQETSVDIVMLISVTTKQNTINLMFQTLEKSTAARSLNSKNGKGILNTNLFIQIASAGLSKAPSRQKTGDSREWMNGMRCSRFVRMFRSALSQTSSWVKDLLPKQPMPQVRFSMVAI